MKGYIEEAKEIANSRGGKCLSSVCPTTKSEIHLECESGHKWATSFGNIKYHTSWCKRCLSISQRKNIGDVHELVLQKNGKCLSNIYINNHTRMEFECSNGHAWKATFNKLAMGRWCPYCSKKVKLTIGEAQEIAKSRNGKCLSIEYINLRSKLIWECCNGHVWSATLNNIKNHLRWCPKCCSRRTQKKLASILQELIGEESVTIRPSWLKNPETNCPLEVDIYFPKCKIAVEYNGEQHYWPIDFAGRGKEWANKQLKGIQKRDKLKRKLIEHNQDKVKHFIIFTYRDTIDKENIKEVLVRKGIL